MSVRPAGFCRNPGGEDPIPISVAAHAPEQQTGQPVLYPLAFGREPCFPWPAWRRLTRRKMRRGGGNLAEHQRDQNFDSSCSSSITNGLIEVDCDFQAREFRTFAKARQSCLIILPCATSDGNERQKNSFHRRKFLDSDIAELDRVAVSGKSKKASSAIFSWMWSVGHEVFDLTEIGIENHIPVKLDLNRRPDDGHFLKVPLTRGSLVSTGSGDHAISRTVILTGIELRILV